MSDTDRKPYIEFQHVSKSFGDADVLLDLNLTVLDNELLVLVGMSGSGKTTTLRLIAGLD